MPPAYDTQSKHFDEYMREVCPYPRKDIDRRIDRLRAEWNAIGFDWRKEPTQ